MSDRAVKKRAKRELEDMRLVLKRSRKKGADQDAVDKAEKLGDELRRAYKSGSDEDLEKILDRYSSHVDEFLLPYRPNAAWETFKALVIALTIALTIRWLVFEPFRIPSGSMIPTLLIGDQLLVNKMVFGPSIWVPRLDPDFSDEGIAKMHKEGSPRYEFNIGGHKLVILAKKLWIRRLPKRGEVVVFLFPRDPRRPGDSKDAYIKRVIGLPGDKIKIADGRLYVNDKMQRDVMVGDYDGPLGEHGGCCSKYKLYEEDLESDGDIRVHSVLHCDPRHVSSPYYYYGPTEVPEGMLLMMGDNRDCSYDSRSWGFVPLSHLKGTANYIHLPLDPDRHYLPRWERFFKKIR